MQNLDEEWRNALIVVAALLIWVVMLSISRPWEPNDKPMFDIWFYYIAQNPEGGTLAYPVGALAYFDLIREVSANATVFSHLFKLLSFFWLGAILWVYSNMYKRRELVVISIIFALMIVVLNATVEIFAASLALLGTYFFMSGKRINGWILVVFAAFVKVFPAFLLPLFFIMEMKKWKEGVPRIALAALLGLALFACSDATLNSLVYQAGRGLQAQDLYANALMVVDMFHEIGVHTAYVTGSVDLAVPPSLGFLVPLSTVLQIASVLAVMWLFFLEKDKEGKFWAYAFLVMAVAVFFGKISSTQFMFWPIVFAIPLAKAKKYGWILPMCVALSFVSFLNFPVFWDAIREMGPVGVAVITARNLLLGAMIIYVGSGLFEKGAHVGKHLSRPYL